MRHSIGQIGTASARSQASAFLAQARDFYSASASSDVRAAKPLLLYYSFLNLAKALVVKTSGATLGRIIHGLSEQLPSTSGAIHGDVLVQAHRGNSQSAFLLLADALQTSQAQTFNTLPFRVRSEDFLAQVLIGHRVYAQGTGIKERFISLEQLRYVHDSNRKTAWLSVRAFADDFTRLGYPLTGLSRSLTKGVDWRNVNSGAHLGGRRLLEAETMREWGYSHRPSQVLSAISDDVRLALWRSVLSVPPYRKYYIYRATSSQIVLDQLLSIYLASFYFGSITRYKPEQFEDILESDIGPFVLEFFENQPSQFLYLMSSEFVKQEVARAAIT